MKQLNLSGNETTVHYRMGNPIKKPNRKQSITQVLENIGGKGTTRQIADELNMNVNGISQTLGCMDNVERTGKGKSGDTEWKIKVIK